MNLINKTFVTITDQFRGDDLKARCMFNSLVLGIGVIVAKGLNFGSKVILARLLVPEELGLMVLILSITSLFQALTEIGIKQSVIQNKSGARPEYLNMAWWFQSLRGIGFYILAFFAAPLLCRFYFANRPEVLVHYSIGELLALVRVTFLAILFWGFSSPRIHILEKEFRFGKWVLITQGSAILGTILTVVLAFLMQNVWALVIGFASMGLLACVLSYIFCPFKPRLNFDGESFQHIYKFARGMLGLPFLTYIAFNIDVLVAGKLVSADLVGMYGMALVLARIPRELFASVISPILLPAFATKQGDREALCRAVLKITKVTALFAIPPLAIMVICSKTVLSLVYGTQFSVVAIPFSLLCFYFVLLTQAKTLGNVFFGIGQPGKHRAFIGIRAVILVLLIYPATQLFGLMGTAASLLMASIVALCGQVVIMRKEIGLQISDYAISWLPGLALAVPVVVIVRLLQGLTPNMPVLHLVAGVLSWMVVCLTGMYLLRGLDIRSRYKAMTTTIVDPLTKSK